MTLILELPDNKEAALKAKAEAHGVSAEQYAAQVLGRDLEEQTNGADELTVAALVEAMQACPMKDVDLEPARYPMPVRDVNF